MKKFFIRILMLVMTLSLMTSNLSIVAGASTVVDQTGLLAYWNLDEGSGSISKEITKLVAGRDLTVKGQTQWVSGKNGKAFYFDGNTVLTMDGAKAIKTDNLTVSLWAKIDSFPASDTGANVFVVNSDLSALDKGAFDFGFYGKGLKSYVVNNFAGGTGDGINDKVDISSQITGKWQHFAVVYNQDEGQEYSKLYLNGNEIETAKLTSILGLQIKLGYPKTASYKKCDFNIGGYVDTAGKVIRSIKGAMDDIAIYGRVLSPLEIKLLASGIRPNQTASSSISSTVSNSKSTSGTSSTKSSITSSNPSDNLSGSVSLSSDIVASEITSGIESSVESASDTNSYNSEFSNVSSVSGDNSTDKGPTQNSKLPLIIIIVIVVIALVAGGYFLLTKRRKI